MPSFTQKAIKASFLKLLNEKPLSHITVKDLVEDCGINRNSFYYHFQDLPALLEEIIREQTDIIIAEHAAATSVEECLDVAINFAMQNKTAVLHIYNSNSRESYERHLKTICQYAISQYIETVFSREKIYEEDKALLIRLYTYVLFGHIMDWMAEGMRTDIRTEFHRICELMAGNTARVFHRSAEDAVQ